MKKGDFIVMTIFHITGCGKVYEVGHIGCLSNNVSDDYVDVRFPTHRTHDSSYIPTSKVVLAENQKKAKKLFEKGEEVCKKVFYK